ncbi:MAG: winged helix-turn-helix domain-containing protein [Gammaproteobacteria bacterium]|nr:winged helix-turn-helix domain-containing protein [Gammaproteobacteria bacterium]MBU1555382.1 winged helix-turn-helix domain-containing protein [Gammaproteobacteria bacterium]MBU2070546.1 winged helix-turn-helix domain-containing protein [Gammaproteobacteria bacterium]MBU2185358.1 winged helix-turn-helix domain-containing protein [Gammaproteobacteria bacterium]MBU2207052.1 winged helix-turn-helix domain-containing protein [Gammaproteobacteria bacterium]
MHKFQLGPWTFIPADFSIYDGDKRTELEPLLCKLLLCFATHPGTIVPRQQLVETIWQQSFVDDNAINRAISELRKALQHDSLSESPIKTHHRKGYSLQLTAAVNNLTVAAQQDTPGLSSSKTVPARRHLHIAAMVTALLVLVSLAFFGYNMLPDPTTQQPAVAAKSAAAPTELTISSQQKITWFKGIESRPLVSPDKQLLAYSHSQPDGSIRTMVRKQGINTGNLLQEVALEDQGKIYSVQTWQPQSSKLLVQAITEDGSHCEYQSYDFSQFPAYNLTPLAGCNGMTLGTAQVSQDGEWLYYSKSKAGIYSGNALLAQNLINGNVQTLLDAPSAGLGVTLLALSADGSKLAYILMPESNKPDIYIYDPASREHSRVASLSMPILLLGLEWSADQSSLLLPGGNGILQVNLADKSRSLLKLPDDVIVGEMSLLTENQAYTSPMTANTTTQGGMQLIKVINAFDASKRQISFLNNAAGSDIAIAISPTDANRYAFAANWTGNWQLWLHTDGQNKQLTELTADNQPVNGISWSGDGRYIAFVQRGNLHLYDTQRQQLITKLENNDIGQPVWLPDNSGLVLTRLQENSQNLWQFDLISNQLTQLTFSAGSFAQYDQHGVLHYHRDGKLYRYVDGTKHDIEVNSSSDNSFVGVWLLQSGLQYRFSMLGHIEQFNAVNGETRKTQLPQRLISLHPDPHNPDNLYATVFVTPELALEFIQWQTAM